MIPLIYHSCYNITAFGLERLHPFDGRKYGRIHDALIARGLRRHGDFVRPRKVSRRDLLKVHTAEYLHSLRRQRGAGSHPGGADGPSAARVGDPLAGLAADAVRHRRHAPGLPQGPGARGRHQPRRRLPPRGGRVGRRVLRVCRRALGGVDSPRRGEGRQGDGRRSRRPPGKRHGRSLSGLAVGHDLRSL